MSDTTLTDEQLWNQTDADGFFIAVASWAVPALVDEVARLRAENERLRLHPFRTDWENWEDSY